MDEESDRTFIEGNRHSKRRGWSLRACNSNEPDLCQINKASELLGRSPFFKDDLGFECEIIAATVHPDQRRIVYIESRSRNEERFVNITIKVHYVEEDGSNHAVDIESYNPFFGCDVGLLEWFDDQVALLVYREKHWTFVYRVGDSWPPSFVKIEDRWQIKEDVLSYMGYKADTVQRLTIPSLTSIGEISIPEALSLDQLPPDPYDL